MRVIIIGNGLGGTIAAKTLREIGPDVEIDIFAEEKYHYYPRPNLIEFMAGNLPMEKIFAYSEEWYDQQKIEVQLQKPVKKIIPASQEIELEGGKTEKYDALLLAAGSIPFVPPFKGAEKRGVFTLRTLDDALEILEYQKNHSRMVVIGGGLLGLEIARALSSGGGSVEVVEFFEHLLPRQLDTQGSLLLKSEIEKMGIKIHLGLATEEILGQEEMKGLKFKGGQELGADMALVAAGIRPEMELGKEAGLEVDRGLVVNDFLQSSEPKIFAAGDILQHGGRIYGIIPATFAQARLVASNILGDRKRYEGTIPWNTLKVAGLYLTSIGLINAEEESQEEIREERREEGIYKKIILQDGIVVGALWIGTKNGVDHISRIISEKKNVGKWKDSILNDDFDFTRL
ncbi:MAG: FAD-dependent oxidoreductase [Candidatus Aminicenantes bacterium]|nr:FAD-dependent oxidoreductase [Candidatus Aminicenantes bacterium]